LAGFAAIRSASFSVDRINAKGYWQKKMKFKYNRTAAEE
jgi:hypothetical protein